MDTDLFDRAAKFAIDAHRGGERKGKGFPYILHPMEAAIIVSSFTTDPEMLAAAMLHDTIEDTDVTIEQIRREFGARVAKLVHHETSPLPHDAPWRDRKQAQAEQLAAAPRDSKIVAIATASPAPHPTRNTSIFSKKSKTPTSHYQLTNPLSTPYQVLPW